MFAVAIDASPDALAGGSWRAMRARLANVAFLVEGVERLPGALTGIADEVTVHFPWGSLLRGLIAADSVVLAPIAALLKAGGELRLVVSASARDAMDELTPELIGARAGVFRDHGLELVTARWATPADVLASRSTWAKRLGVGRNRSAVFASYRRSR